MNILVPVMMLSVLHHTRTLAETLSPHRSAQCLVCRLHFQCAYIRPVRDVMVGREAELAKALVVCYRVIIDEVETHSVVGLSTSNPVSTNEQSGYHMICCAESSYRIVGALVIYLPLFYFQIHGD